MIVKSDCPRCGNRDRLKDGLCPTCVLQQALGLFADSDTPSVDPSTSTGDRTIDRLTEFLAPAEAPDEIGRLGAYRVLDILGHGGMGVVYRAEDPGLQRLVAVKAMLPNLAGKGDRSRFLREARAAAAVSDDHVVSIFQVSEDGGIPFVAMELLEGESLDTRMRREPRLSMAEIVRVGRETALGLAAAHAQGVVHRDIKPGNLWLEAKGSRVKILDFGLARLTSDDSHVTQPGVIIGTPAYMAPEQTRGGDPDPRCDLFSLGCVLYRLCTGNTPFRGKDTLALVAALALDTPASPSQCNPQVPAEFSDFILRLLEKDASLRPASASEVVEALARMPIEVDASHASAASAQPAPSLIDNEAETRSLLLPERAGTGVGSPRRRRGTLIGLAFAALAAAVVGMVLFLQTRDGVIRVEVRDPKIEVKLGNGNLIVKGRGEKEITITPGKNWLRVEREGFAFDTKQFALNKGDKLRFLVEWVDGKIVVAKDGGAFDEKGKPKDPIVAAPKEKEPPPVDPNRAAAEWVLNLKGEVNGVGNIGFRSLAALPKTPFQVGLIGLEGRPVFDDDLARIEKLSELHFLDLTTTQISDAGLVHLQGLTKLEMLRLDGDNITDAGLPRLKGFSQLRRLFLGGTSITDDGLPHLKDLQLLVLGLVNTNIGDAGVAHIVTMPTVDRVALNNTAITDKALELLTKMTSLKNLCIDDTKVSAKALIAFRKARPDVEVTSSAIEGKSVTYPATAAAPLDWQTRRAGRRQPPEVNDEQEGWIDLLPRIDLKADVLEGSFERDGAALVNTGGYFNRLRLPVRIKGGYELSVDFIETDSPPNLHNWSLPAGDIRIGLWVKQTTSIDKTFQGFAELDSVYGEDTGIIKSMKKQTLRIRIEPAPTQCRVHAEIDGKPFSRWQGTLKPEYDQISHDFFKGGDRDEPVLHLRKGIVRILALRLRTLDGEIRLLRP